MCVSYGKTVVKLCIHKREVFVSSEIVQPIPTLVLMEADEENEIRRKRSIVEVHNKRRAQRDEAFFKRTGLTVAQARDFNAMDLDGPPATRKQPSSHSYSFTHPVKLTHEQKESIKQKLLAPVVRRHRLILEDRNAPTQEKTQCFLVATVSLMIQLNHERQLLEQAHCRQLAKQRAARDEVCR